MSELKKPVEEMTDEDWREQLDEKQYRIMREAGTEPAFSGIYWDNHDDGVYRCGCCNSALFASDAKFESGSGWPSFDKPVSDDAIREVTDTSHGMARSEIVCANCGGHIGHVFPDGPRATTGLRYCTNSASLDFEKQD